MSQENEVIKARVVRDMFGAIAGRYDFLNHLLSANIDRRWRRVCVSEVQKRRPLPNPRVLDVGCGTADLALAFAELGPVVGCDFCHAMLCLGRKKAAGTGNGYRVHLLEGDALELPFADASFDIVVSAFVLRNLASVQKGLGEMRRVLRPGGVLGILDFGLPQTPLLGRLYLFYFTRILPRLGRVISGVEGPYQYLPDSVQSFPPPHAMKAIIAATGFANVECRLITAGIVVLFLGSVGH